MDAEIYPEQYEPFKVFAGTPHTITVLISDREPGSFVRVNTNQAGLEQLVKVASEALEKLKVSGRKST